MFVKLHCNSSKPLLFPVLMFGCVAEFFDNSGFVFEFAKEVGALVVFGEHVSPVECTYHTYLFALGMAC